MQRLGATPVEAARLWRRAVTESLGSCFGQELVQRRRFVQGPLTQLWHSRRSAPDDWSEAWQRNALALCHTGARRVLTCPDEVNGALRLRLGPGGTELRVLVDVHFFSWFLVPTVARRQPPPQRVGRERLIEHPAQLLDLAAVPCKGPSPSAKPPWRVPRLLVEGRVRPDRVTIEPGGDGGAEPDGGAGTVAVAVRNMVPTGGNHLLPGWGSTAVVLQRVLWLRGLDTETAGDVLAGEALHMVVGTSNLRREDLWRNAVDGHAERAPLACPTEPSATPFAWLDDSAEWLTLPLQWRRF